jgi:hypothetical protein
MTVSPSPEQLSELIAGLREEAALEAKFSSAILDCRNSRRWQAADALESSQSEIARLTTALDEIKRGLARECEYAARLEKEHPDCRYREGIAEGVCDLSNFVTPILSAALKDSPFNQDDVVRA